jgi:hypothetical protein
VRKPSLHDPAPRFVRIDRFEACWWIVIRKWVVRIGKPWGPFRYAWRPLVSVFRVYR